MEGETKIRSACTSIVRDFFCMEVGGAEVGRGCGQEQRGCMRLRQVVRREWAGSSAAVR